MQGQSEGTGQDAYGSRMLSPRVFLSHNNHVQAGERRSTRCGFCTKGLDGVAPQVEENKPEPDLVEDNRGDEEEAATPTSDSGWYRE